MDGLLTFFKDPKKRKPERVKVGQPSDTFIKLVPFIWGSISEGTIKKGVRTIMTGWGKFQKKGIVC